MRPNPLSADLAPGGPIDRPRPSISPGTALALALAPALAAVWLVPGFVTQDGPAHLYNAHILSESFDPSSPFRAYYEVRLDPLPNWAGHLLLAGVMAFASPWTADRVAMTVTLAGFAGAVLWLRVRVAGREGSTTAAILAALLGLNVVWLFGFTSFLLGACLFPITLGVWWGGRARFGPGRAAALAGLVVLGYLCHLVALGLTAVGVAVLAAATPTTGRGLRARSIWTAVGLAPLLPLAVVYRGLTRDGGPMAPEWGHLADPLSPASWAAQLGWADPISLGGKLVLPFVPGLARWHALFTPMLWFTAGLALLVLATVRGAGGRGIGAIVGSGRRGWVFLAALLILGGTVGPDSLGTSHGHYLPQRVALLGLAALVPVLDLASPSRTRRAGTAALAFALAVQSGLVWDYARESDRTAGLLASARDAVGTGRRVATLLVDIRGRWRANPLLHADNLLGVGTGNVIWSNYETSHYYFPIQFRPDLARPPAADLEAVAIRDDDPDARAAMWAELMGRSADAVDVLVVWGRDPRLDALNDRWFEPVAERGPVRVFRRRAGRP